MENNIERLRLLSLPVFSTIEELASLIHVDPKRLFVLANSSNTTTPANMVYVG